MSYHTEAAREALRRMQDAYLDVDAHVTVDRFVDHESTREIRAALGRIAKDGEIIAARLTQARQKARAAT